jgi:hypothetical protein
MLRYFFFPPWQLLSMFWNGRDNCLLFPDGRLLSWRFFLYDLKVVNSLLFCLVLAFHAITRLTFVSKSIFKKANLEDYNKRKVFFEFAMRREKQNDGN